MTGPGKWTVEEIEPEAPPGADYGPSVRDLMGGSLNLSMSGDISFGPEHMSPREEPPTYGGKSNESQTLRFITPLLHTANEPGGQSPLPLLPPLPAEPDFPDDSELQRPPVCQKDVPAERREAADLEKEVAAAKAAAAAEQEQEQDDDSDIYIEPEVPAPAPTNGDQNKEKEQVRFKRSFFQLLARSSL